MQLNALCKSCKLLLTPQTLRCMKITAFLVFLFTLHLSAATIAQTVTLSEHKVPLEKVLNDIRQQSGYVFFYNQDWMQQSKPVDLEVKNLPLEQALKAAFKDQPFDYAIVNKTIVLKLKEKPVPAPNAQAQAVTITGKVTNELGEPMSGATVKQKDNPANGTLTDTKGNYTLTVPDDKTVIEFSYIGFEPQEFAAKDLPAGSVIKLKAAENNLQEVVINKGYYDEKRELSTGDVGIVTAKTIQEQPVFDPIQALIGRVAGLNIQQTSGVPGAYATINIRGVNSLLNGNDPLYVVDDVPFSSVTLTNASIGGGALGNSIPQGSNVTGVPLPNGGTSTGLSPFSAINPDDIESIEILKDADATSIYGSRGANGVVLITTKKGKAGDTRVNFDVSQGIGQVGHFVDMLNTQQYLQAWHQAYKNDNLPFPSIQTNQYDGNYSIDGVWDTTRNTNWQKALIGGTAHYTNAQGSISGGTANTQFLIGGGYSRQTTVYPGDYNDRKGSLHFSLNHASSNQRFHVQLTGSYMNDNNIVPPVDFTGLINLPPDAPTLHNPDGSLNWAFYNGGHTFDNPLASAVSTNASVTNNLISNLDLSYKILPGLMIKSDFGYNHDEMNQTNLIPSTSWFPPFNTISALRSNTFATTVDQGWIINPQLTYQKQIAKGQLHVLIGATLQQSSSQSIAEQASDFANDALITNPQAANSFSLLNNVYSLYRYEAYVGRLNYTWDDKYLFNATFNRDGSTRFGPGRQYGNFGAVGAGWIFSKEKLVSDNLPWLTFGKLRASYGTSGNDQIGDYQYLSTYSINSTQYQGTNGLYPTVLANPNFSWEVDRKLEVGLDLSFFGDRISPSVSYYQNRTSNQLVSYPLPVQTGASSFEYNLPADVQNSGWEVQLNTVNIKTTSFTWTSNINFTAPQNKLLAFQGLATSSYSSYYTIGQSLYSQLLYQYTGVNSQTGLYTFKTQNSNGKPSAPQDQYLTPPITQKYYGGISNDFTYKGFSLDIFFQFVKQLGYSYQYYYYPIASGGFNINNVPTAELTAWQAAGQSANVQKFSTSSSANNLYNDFKKSNAAITDASFIRLKNVSLSYRLPEAWQHWAGMKNARVYIQGQNLYTFTKYVGLDPETQGLTLPPLRVIMAGVSASF